MGRNSEWVWRVVGMAAICCWVGQIADVRAEEKSGKEPADISDQVFTLGDIEVHGKAENAKNITVNEVTHETMRWFDADTVADAPNLTPGVSLDRSGARNETTVNVRGFTSVLYGPNTMGGAINIVSRKPTEPFEVEACAGYSSGETWNTHGNFGTHQGKRDYHEEHNEGKPIQHFEDEIFSAGVEDTFDIMENFYTIAGMSYDRVSTVEAEDLDGAGQPADFPTGRTDAFNVQGGLFYKIFEKGLLHAAVSRKTRLPSMKDKYSHRMGRASPTPTRGRKRPFYPRRDTATFFSETLQPKRIFFTWTRWAFSSVWSTISDGTVHRTGAGWRAILRWWTPRRAMR